MDTRGNRIIYHFFILTALLFFLFVISAYIRIMTSSDEIGSDASYVLPVDERVVRGSLYDRNGKLAAAEVPTYSLACWIPDMGDLQKSADVLADILRKDSSLILEKLSGRKGFLYLQRGFSAEEKQYLEKKISSSPLSGVYFEKSYGRFYPYHELAAQTIGFTDPDNNGLSGIEYFFNDLLYPLPDPARSITFGNDIVMTLDMDIQLALHRTLLDISEDHNPDGVTGVIAEAETGEILALSSFPVFDLNEYQHADPAAVTNRSISYMHEPGSVFKVFSLAALIESGQINSSNSSDEFYCDGSLDLMLDNGSAAVIRCVHPHGSVGIEDILKYSCNGAIAYHAMKVSDEAFYNTLRRFGFGSRTGITLPGEISGILPEPDDWSARTKPTLAFGQESGITAMQITAGAAAIAGGGRQTAVSIIKDILPGEGSLGTGSRIASGLNSETHAEEVQEKQNPVRVVSEETAGTILDYMTYAAEPGGTAELLHRDDFRIAAKTGTAQLLDPETGTYSDTRYLASCLVIFPVPDPEYIIYIAAENPSSGQIYGSTVVVPYMNLLIDFLAEKAENENNQHEK